MKRGNGIGGFFRSLVGVSEEKKIVKKAKKIGGNKISNKSNSRKIVKTNNLKVKKHKVKVTGKIKLNGKATKKLRIEKKLLKRKLAFGRKAKKIEEAKKIRLSQEQKKKELRIKKEAEKKKKKELRERKIKIGKEKAKKLKEEKAKELVIKKAEESRKRKAREEAEKKKKEERLKKEAERKAREARKKEKALLLQKKQKREKKEAERRKKEAAKKKAEGEFFNLGIPGFSNLVGKGIPLGTSNLIEGGPGSGKTIFCLGVAADACKQGKKVLYMSFEEQEERLKKHMKSFGWDADEFERKKLLYIKRFNALDIARSVEALLSEAKKELLIEVQPILIPSDFKPDIVLVDSLSSIASAFSGEESRFRIYMEQLFRYLEANGITSFLIRETANPTHIGSVFVERGEAVSFLSDGIIVLYNVFYRNGRRDRAMEIVKMRGIDINRKIVKAGINGKGGFIIYPNKVLSDGYRLT